MANSLTGPNVGMQAVIQAPPLTAPPLSLVQLAPFVVDDESATPSDGRWEAGFTFLGELAGAADGLAACGGTLIDHDADCGTQFVNAVFVADKHVRQSTAGFRHFVPDDGSGDNEYVARAVRALRAHEAWRVENELWTAAIQPGNVGLASAGATVLAAGGAVGIREAISLLDQAIADSDAGQGMIHMTPYMLESLATRGFPIVREGGRVKTVNGNDIVPGYGYDGTGPTGSTGGGGRDVETQWAFATDRVYLLRGRIQTYPTGAAELGYAVDRVLNDVYWVAQRSWGIATNGLCRAAVKVDLTLP